MLRGTLQSLSLGYLCLDLILFGCYWHWVCFCFLIEWTHSRVCIREFFLVLCVCRFAINSCLHFTDAFYTLKRFDKKIYAVKFYAILNFFPRLIFWWNFIAKKISWNLICSIFHSQIQSYHELEKFNKNSSNFHLKCN